MRIQHGDLQFELPGDLRVKLARFRRRVWMIKTAEATLIVVTLGLLSYLAVFALDRFGETPAWLRGLLLLGVAGAAICGLPWQLNRWVWRNRSLSQLARLLSRDQPRVGDRLLGVIELVQGRPDQHASPALCRAAIQQVADDTRDMDFQRSVPKPRHLRLGVVAFVTTLIAGLALCIPGAGLNTFHRWLRPWAVVPRYTFTQLDELPLRQVVASGEGFQIFVKLDDATVWRPRQGRVRYLGQPPIVAERSANGYEFNVPAQTQSGILRLAVGDARHELAIEPQARPELESLLAQITLPEYLGCGQEEREARSGVVSIVKGSRARFEAKASRRLRDASVNGQRVGVQVDGSRIQAPPVDIVQAQTQEFRWTDVEGLSAREPFRLLIRAVDDRAPTVQCSQLTTDQVVLDEDPVRFEVAASDDFGVKQIGVEWMGVDDPHGTSTPPQGDYLLAAGAMDSVSMTAAGLFSPQALGIAPQPIQLRVYVEDYLPGRPRVYSPVYRFFVLDRQQHMIWVTQQLENWQRQALEVRDQEQRLLATNRELRQLSAEQLNRDDTRQRIARQAAAERANARRLADLTIAGEALIERATNNPEFNVATLEKWAQVLQVLKQLSQQNMPSVANHLAEAANAPKTRASSPSLAPSVSDAVRPSGRDPDEPSAGEESAPSTPSSAGGSLQLPATTLPGAGTQTPESSGESPAEASTEQPLDQAVTDQAALLAEFSRVMDELSQILQDLQGSTFVKRLKAAADSELKLADELHARLQDSFGRDHDSLSASEQAGLESLAVNQADTAQQVRLIQEDLAAYYERTRLENFKHVFDEMKRTEVIKNFQDLSFDVMRNRQGYTIAQTEYWSDQLDRWAEILVGPGCASGGKRPGGKGDSLPPAIVLEVLRILKAEVDLRESTRVAEQRRPAQPPDAYGAASAELRAGQVRLEQRVQWVIDELQRLESDEGKDYAPALKQVVMARNAMRDAAELLAVPVTAAPTIAAETEAIEALLITRRGKQGGGGRGGSAPGGGSGEGGADEPSALAGIGDALMTSPREVAQATGKSQAKIPDEFRSGLDAYFSALEGRDGN